MMEYDGGTLHPINKPCLVGSNAHPVVSMSGHRELNVLTGVADEGNQVSAPNHMF